MARFEENSLSAEFLRPEFLRRLEQLKIHTRRSFLGSRQGGHTSLRRGHGLEFADYRPYTAGDDFRMIDWNVLGKSDRIYVRQYREEQDLNVLFLLDGSASMRAKADYAELLLLALSYVALAGGDSVALGVLGGATSPRYRSLAAINREREFLRAHGSAEWDSLLPAVQAAAARLRFPGKCFLISDCLFETSELIQAVDFIRGKNFEICLLQVLAPHEMELTLPAGALRARDAEKKLSVSLQLDERSAAEYQKLLAEHLAGIEAYAARAGVNMLTLSTADNPEDVLLARLPALGILK